MRVNRGQKAIRTILTLLGVVGYASLGQAQTYTISPSPYLLAQNNAGAIINNACIWTYTAGTTTPATTYSDNIGTQNLNPIRSDSAGRFTAYLVPGSSYKFVYESTCTPPAHGTVLRTADNVAAVPASAANVDTPGTAGEALTAGQAVYLSDGSGGKNAGQWYKADSANGYSSSTAVAVGMVPSSITSGGSGTIRLAGQITGLTSLTIGSTYYIGTGGAVTSTAPSNVRQLGIADTTSSLVLNTTTAAPNADNSIDDFRLTLTTGVPVTTADVTGASAVTIFCTPSGRGNRLALYDSAGVATVYTSAQFSIAVPATTVTMYDIFAFSNSGVPTLELLAWTNDTTRATAIVLTTTGTYTKSGDLTRRYLGSFRTTGVSGQTEDSYAKRYLWNYYNRVNRPMRVLEATDSWTYTTATWRQANAAATNQVDVVVGVAEDAIDVEVLTTSSNNNANVHRTVGIGEDSTTTPVIGSLFAPTLGLSAASQASLQMASYQTVPAVGRHFYVWLEYSAATGTTQWIGDNGGTLTQSGMRAMWRN